MDPKSYNPAAVLLPIPVDTFVVFVNNLLLVTGLIFSSGKSVCI